MGDAARKGVLALVAGALSIPFAFCGLEIAIKLGIRTPGVFVVGHLSLEDLHDSILGSLALQMGIDWLFWFALICTLYWLYGRLATWDGQLVRLLFLQRNAFPLWPAFRGHIGHLAGGKTHIFRSRVS